MKFYASVECLNCDEPIYLGPCLTLLEHQGLPVIPSMTFEMEKFPCSECGAMNYVGELDTIHEGGEERKSD